MKKFIVPVVFIYFFMSCSSDDASIINNENLPFKEKSLLRPENVNNQYDFLGELHAQILEDYLELNNIPSPVDDVVNDVDDIAENNTVFNTISNDYTGLITTKVIWIVQNAYNPENIVYNMNMTGKGKTELLDFVNLLYDFESKPYTYVYDTIVNFENKILNDITINASDKQTILTATSTARYSIAYAYGKDRKWSKTRTGIIASINSDVAEAVTTSVAANIMAE